jgi:CheY-like chemotaxis protein
MKIAIVDDEQDMRQSISQWLALSGFETETYPSAEDALKSIGSDFPGVVVTDMKMPGMDGDELSQAPDGAGQRPAGDHDHRPRRRADGGGGDADRGLRLSWKSRSTPTR